MGAIYGTNFLVGIVVSVLMLVSVVGVWGAFVVIVVANRADPDPSGRRPFAVYSFGVSFITVWTAFIGSVAVVFSLVDLIGSHSQVESMSLHPIGDASARGVALGGIIFVVSMAVWSVHQRRGSALADADAAPSGPASRVRQSYVSAVSFVSMMILIVSAIVFAYTVFRLIAPGVFGGGGRVPDLRVLIDSGYVAIAVALIRANHMAMAAPAEPVRAVNPPADAV